MAEIDRRLLKLGIECREGEALSAGRPDRRREEFVRYCFGEGGQWVLSESTGAKAGLGVGVIWSGSAITTAR